LNSEGGEDGLPLLLGGPHQGDGALHRVEREPVAQDALEEPDRPPTPPRSGKRVLEELPPVPVEFPSVTEAAYRFSRVTASGTFAFRKKISSTSIRW